MGLILALVATVLVPTPTAIGAPGDLTLASTSNAGVKGTEDSTDPSLSADGTRVAFISEASDLDPNDIDYLPEVYVKDLATGDLMLASVTEDGQNPPFSQAGEPDLSADGTRVAFWCSGLVPDASICVKDLMSGQVLGVQAGTFLNADPTLSADGSVMAFASSEELDGVTTCGSEQNTQIWVVHLDPVPSPPQRVTCNETLYSRSSSFPVISGDGTRVAFSSTHPLVPEDNDDCPPPTYELCGQDIYVADLVTGEFILASSADDGTDGNGDSLWAAITHDGTKVAFTTWATNLDPADTNDDQDVYVKDLVTGDVTWASESADPAYPYGGSSNHFPSLSADGTKVAFGSGRLVEADNDWYGDIYVKDLVTGELSLASTSDAGVKACGISQEPSLSADGSKVAFWSAADFQEPGDDDDFIGDVYVKEVGGGSVYGCGVSPVSTPTRTTYTGQDSVQYSDPVTLSGLLEDISGSPAPISGKTLQFTVGTQAASAGPTDASGNASSQLVVTQQPGSATQVATSFAGDSTYEASADSDPFSILKEDCTLTYAGDILVPPLADTTLAVDLGEPDASLGDRSSKAVTFTVTDSVGSVQTFGAMSDDAGRAEVQVPLPAEVYAVSGDFAGDDFYHPCTTPPMEVIVSVEQASAKVTGGGWINAQGGANFGLNLIPHAGGRFTTQFQLRARGGSGRFHAGLVESVRVVSSKSVSWTGTGSWLRQEGCSYRITVVDNGSSGSRKGDTIEISIACNGLSVYSTGGPQQLKGGNLTVHRV